ncbi:MAG: hypothetical protein GEU96_03910 [Propionibacteriales bacterium]|nr:hypothetical protein [Propionibacteriales bacterium]
MSEAADAFSLPRDKRFTVIFFGGLLLLLGLLYLAAYLFTSDRVPRGTEVAGVEIGGMRPAAAVATLEEDLAPRAKEPLTLVADDKRHEVAPDEAGLTFDPDATVADAGGGRSLNPLRMLSVLTGGEDVEPVVDVDPARLEKAMTAVAKEVDQKPVEGLITFPKGEIETRYPKPGLKVDTDAAGAEVAAAVLRTERTVDLPVATVDPSVTEDDVDQAMRTFAEPAMAHGVALTVPGKRVALHPRQYAPALSVRAVDAKMTPKVDTKKLAEGIKKPLRRLVAPPRDARVELRGSTPVVVPAREGTKVDSKGVAAELVDALAKSGTERTIALKAEKAQPKFTTQAARDLKITERVSSFVTYFPHSDYRNTNLGRAADKIDGTVLKPDDIFSLNDIVGERTKENGFVEGFIINNGVLERDLGGGVSQVATTTYNAAFFAGLKDVEHKPHSFYIDRYPMGREATVAWGAVDLKFQNTTPYGVLVHAWIVPSSSGSRGEMHVEMFSTRFWDKIEAGLSDRYNRTSPKTRYNTTDKCEEQTGASGFDVDVTRTFFRDGTKTDTEKWNVTYIPADEVKCSPPPKKKPTASPSTGTGG